MKRQVIEHRKKYAENFKKVMASVGKPSHATYLKIEDELDKSGVALRRSLGVFAEDPCFANHPKKDCFKCLALGCIIKRSY